MVAMTYLTERGGLDNSLRMVRRTDKLCLWRHGVAGGESVTRVLMDLMAGKAELGLERYRNSLM